MYIYHVFAEFFVPAHEICYHYLIFRNLILPSFWSFWSSLCFRGFEGLHGQGLLPKSLVSKFNHISWKWFNYSKKNSSYNFAWDCSFITFTLIKHLGVFGILVTLLYIFGKKYTFSNFSDFLLQYLLVKLISTYVMVYTKYKHSIFIRHIWYRK